MCPSFMATREEEHSTRGRANALRAVLSGAVESDGMGDRRLFETLDLCLECKACVSECPSSVDMAKLKMEFLAQYQDRHGVPLRSRLFGRVARSARRASGVRAVAANTLLRQKPVRWMMERSMGIARERPLPTFARTPFTTWFEDRPRREVRGEPIVLFNDTFNTYNYPDVARAATLFLEACGFEVRLSNHGCCGRPMLSKGMLREAREAADATLDALAPLARDGLTIVGLEPSCLLSFRDEYASLLPGDPRVVAVAERALLFDEFLAGLDLSARLQTPFTLAERRVLYHGHCHQKALAGTAASLQALGLPPGYVVEEVDSGCCGMAGSFGFEAEHYDVSMRIGEDRLFPAVRRAGASALVCAPGVSCRQQIEHGTGRKALHPAEVLWEALESGKSQTETN